MPIMTDLTTGEQKEVSMEEFLESIDEEELCIKQVVRNADGTETSSVIYGSEKNDDRLHTLNIFTSMQSVINVAFIKLQEAKKKNLNLAKPFQMNNKYSECEVIVDDMNNPLTYVFSFSADAVNVQSYVRDERRSIMGTPTVDQRYPFVNGEIWANVNDIQNDCILCFVFGIYEMMKFLEKQGFLLQLKEMKNQGCGVLVTGSDEITIKIVKGLERPELPCVLFGGMFAKSTDDIIMMRPYVDEIFKDDRSEDLIKKRLEIQPISNMICVEAGAVALINAERKVLTFGLPISIKNEVESWEDIKQICLWNHSGYSTNTVYAVALGYDGKIRFSGSTPECPSIKAELATWCNVDKIANSHLNIYGIDKQGNVCVAGWDIEDLLMARQWKNIKKIIAHPNWVIGFKENSEIEMLGPSYYERPRIPRGRAIDITGVVEENVGIYGLTEDGRVITPYIDDKTLEWKNIVSIARGGKTIVGITLDGKLLLAYEGEKQYADTKKWDKLVYATGNHGLVIGLTEDGYVKVSGQNVYPGLQNIRLFNNYLKIEEEREEIRVKKIENQICKLENDISNIRGLFANMKKKQLQEKIDELKSRI